MKQGLEAFKLIQGIQGELSRAAKSPAQRKKFEQFQMNFEKLSTKFMDMLEQYKSRNVRLGAKDFEDSEFR